MRTKSTIAILLAAVVGGLAVGCNKAPFDLAPVHGTVTLDGKPLTHGKVMFAPIRTGKSLEAGKPAIGVIQPDGSFQLTTYHDGDGAVVGEHWATVFGPDPTVLAPTTSSADELTTAIATFDRINITERQSVKPGTDNQIEIALTSHQLAKFSTRAD